MRILAIAIALIATMGTAKAAEIDAFISTALKTVTDEKPFASERWFIEANGNVVKAAMA